MIIPGILTPYSMIMTAQGYRMFTAVEDSWKNISHLKGITMDPITRPATLSAQVGPLAANAPEKDPLMKAAQDLEASFLAEMLKAAGVGKSRESFGGGVGEDQFSSFLVQAQAEEMVKSGGIGLAESLFHALKEGQNGAL